MKTGLKKSQKTTEIIFDEASEFIEKIVVSAPEKIDGKRHQTVDIYYHGTGIIKMLSVEELEEAYRQHISKQHKTKTAWPKLYRSQITLFSFTARAASG